MNSISISNTRIKIHIRDHNFEKIDREIVIQYPCREEWHDPDSL